MEQPNSRSGPFENAITLRALGVALFTAIISVNALLIHQWLTAHESERATLIAERVIADLEGIDVRNRGVVMDRLTLAAARWSATITLTGADGGYLVATPPEGARENSRAVTGAAATEAYVVRVQTWADGLLIATLNANLITVSMVWLLALLYALVELGYRRTNAALCYLIDALEDNAKTAADPFRTVRAGHWITRTQARELSEKLIRTRAQTEVEREVVQRARHEQEQAERRLAVSAHDLRAPIGNIEAHAKALQGQLDRGDGREGAARTNVEGILAACATAELLLSGHLHDHGRQNRNRHAVAVVEQVVVTHQKLATAKGVSIDLWIHPDVPARMSVSDKALWHGVSNLLANAVRFSPEGSTVHVRMGPEPGARESWVVDVMDNGPGVPDGWDEKIFEEGIRAEGARQESAGFGLGLSAARSFARWEGGTACVMRGEHLGSGAWFRWSWKGGRGVREVCATPLRTVRVAVPESPEIERALIAHAARIDGVLAVGTDDVELRQFDLELRASALAEPSQTRTLHLAEHPFGDSNSAQTILMRWATIEEIEGALGLRSTIDRGGPDEGMEQGTMLLLVDDSVANAHALAALIRSLFPALSASAIATAISGEQAREKLKAGAADIRAVIADYEMPGGEYGTELVRWIRTQYPHIRCAVITGYHRAEIRQKAFAAGAQVVFGRPVREEDLRRWIRDVAGNVAGEGTQAAPPTTTPEPGHKSENPAERSSVRRDGIASFVQRARAAVDAEDRTALRQVLHAAYGTCAMLEMRWFAERFRALEAEEEQGASFADIAVRLGEIEDGMDEHLLAGDTCAKEGEA